MVKNWCYPIIAMVGVNNCQPIIQMSTIMVYLYTTYKHINQFAIGYMLTPSILINKLSREQVENA